MTPIQSLARLQNLHQKRCYPGTVVTPKFVNDNWLDPIMTPCYKLHWQYYKRSLGASEKSKVTSA